MKKSTKIICVLFIVLSISFHIYWLNHHAEIFYPYGIAIRPDCPEYLLFINDVHFYAMPIAIFILAFLINEVIWKTTKTK